MGGDPRFWYLFGGIWLAVGASMLLVSLGMMGFVDPAALNEDGTPLWIFSLVGLVSGGAGIAIIWRARDAAAYDKHLLDIGVPLTATVTDVVASPITINRQTRWDVCYRYEFNGRKLEGKSHALPGPVNDAPYRVWYASKAREPASRYRAHVVIPRTRPAQLESRRGGLAMRFVPTLGFSVRCRTTRRVAAAGAALIGLIACYTAAADDTADCLGQEPAVGIPACTRLIQHGDLTAAASGYANRGRFYVAQNELDLALADLAEALRLNPGNADAHHNRGFCYALQGHYDEALAALSESIRLNPSGAAESYHTRGRIYTDVGELDAAMEAFNAALDVDPKHVDALISRGGIHQLKGEFEPAMADFNRVVAIEPDNVDVYDSRGVLYLATSRYVPAIADFSQAIKLNPNDEPAYRYRGMAYLFQKQFDRATADLDQAIRMEPEDAEAYLQRASVYAMQGQFDQAISEFGRVIQIQPENLQARSMRAGLLQQAGRREAAIADYRAVLLLDPTDAKSKEALKQLGVP